MWRWTNENLEKEPGGDSKVGLMQTYPCHCHYVSVVLYLRMSIAVSTFNDIKRRVLSGSSGMSRHIQAAGHYILAAAFRKSTKVPSQVPSKTPVKECAVIMSFC